MAIFNYNYFYFTHADDTTFFLKDVISTECMVDFFFIFYYFSKLKLNLAKSQFVDIGVLIGVQIAVFGMLCKDLNIDLLKILGTHFFYNKN